MGNESCVKNKLEILISCMHEKDSSIAERSGITGDALIINQCDTEGISELSFGGNTIRRIDTTQRGLSRSRNMAIENAKAEYCLLCDDDELFELDYYEKICAGFEGLPDADIIVFRINNQPCKLPVGIYKLKYLQCLNVASWQIAFRRESIVNSGVRFCVHMGAGSGNGCGEENKFLLDAMKKGLKIYHYPEEVASVKQEVSTWFKGYDRKFFYQRGCATRHMLGLPVSAAYAVYYAVFKRNMYSKEISMSTALYEMLKGIINNDISKEEKQYERL